MVVPTCTTSIYGSNELITSSLAEAVLPVVITYTLDKPRLLIAAPVLSVFVKYRFSCSSVAVAEFYHYI